MSESDTGPESGQDAPPTDRLTVLWVRVGDRRYAIEAGWVQHVAEAVSVTGVPRTPQCVTGVADIAGAVTVVVDVAAVLDRRLPSAASDGPVVQLARTDGDDVGLLVDAVGDFENVAVSRLEPVDRDPSLDPAAGNPFLGRDAPADESDAAPTSHWLRAFVDDGDDGGDHPSGVLDVTYLLEQVATTTEN